MYDLMSRVSAEDTCSGSDVQAFHLLVVFCPLFCPSAGLYMNQLGYPNHPYRGSFHSLGQIGGMGGAMMPSQMAMSGRSQSSMAIGGHQNGMMGAHAQVGVAQQQYMSGMIRPQGMMGHQQNGMMGQQQNGLGGQQQNPMMQQPMGGMAGLPQQQVYGALGQQPQQVQWNVSQVGSIVLTWRFGGDLTIQYYKDF